MAFIAGAILVPAVLVPFVSSTTLFGTNTYSLVGGIAELYASGHFFLGVVVTVFSLVFPFAKILGILLATSGLVPLPLRWRRVIHKFAELTGRLSVLDVLVVAVLVVVSQGVARVRVEPGLVMFCASVLLTVLSGLCVHFPREELG